VRSVRASSLSGAKSFHTQFEQLEKGACNVRESERVCVRRTDHLPAQLRATRETSREEGTRPWSDQPGKRTGVVTLWSESLTRSSAVVSIGKDMASRTLLKIEILGAMCVA
jgi:hypothetical protein